ncbi:hypothetical protein G3M63_11790 [Pseudomonas sp. OIL-1]|nr:hypothetical protein G3M63_11790 [Pseudomonas sp. OIL-1]
MLLLFCASGLAHGWDMTRIMQQTNELYEPDRAARKRLQAWHALLDQQKLTGTEAQLDAVNRFFNAQLFFADDRVIWGEADYWATPVESLVNGSADCEDFTISKYFSLLKLGVPDEQLRLTYVKSLKLDQAHMVLSYYPTPLSEPLILDNLVRNILPASRRSDLLPVYSFNSQGLWLPGKVSDRRVGSSRNLPQWQDLARKMRDEGFDMTLRTAQ